MKMASIRMCTLDWMGNVCNICNVNNVINVFKVYDVYSVLDIFIGNMSVIGLYLGLWNQDLLTAECNKYGANDIKLA